MKDNIQSNGAMNIFSREIMYYPIDAYHNIRSMKVCKRERTIQNCMRHFLMI